MFICVCGYEGNQNHSKSCLHYKQELKRIEENIKSYISDVYSKTYSVTECCEYVKKKENTKVTALRLRKIINDKLDSQGIREGLSGKNLNKIRQEKMTNTMLKKYGVINNGQRDGQGWKELNVIEYKKLGIDSKLIEFRKRVDYLTRKHVQKLKSNNSIPTNCYYTGIEFQDTKTDKVNPNDPFKRTVDHKIPVIEMFIKGKTPEATANEENIVFCLRIVNTYKANTSEHYFINEIVPYLKEKIYEG
jgi:hypothetical protein